MIKTLIIINNKAGLHARAAAKFVETSSKFNSKVELGNSDKMVDGKNILSIMLLAAPLGTELKLVIDGEDEKETLLAIQALVDNRFDED